jgi:hypothetical protein
MVNMSHSLRLLSHHKHSLSRCYSRRNEQADRAKTVKECYDGAQRRFGEASIPDAESSARYLICHAADVG